MTSNSAIRQFQVSFPATEHAGRINTDLLASFKANPK
jgi:hypothetical protein